MPRASPRSTNPQPLADADPRPRPDDRRVAPGADPGRVRGRAAGGGDPSGPAPVLPLDRVGRARRDGRDRHPVLPGPARPDGPPRRARRARRGASAAPTSSATCATRWGTSSTTPTGSTTTEEWVELFGPITQPYVEEYRPRAVQPAIRPPPAGLVRPEAPRRGLGRDVRRLDDPRPRLAATTTPTGPRPWPSSQYCDRTMAALADLDPVVTADDLDEDVGELAYSLEQYLPRPVGAWRGPFPAGLDGALLRRSSRTSGHPEVAPPPTRRASGLGADPPARARPGGGRLPLDRPLPRADPPAAPPPGRPRRRAGPGLPRRSRGRR